MHAQQAGGLEDHHHNQKQRIRQLAVFHQRSHQILHHRQHRSRRDGAGIAAQTAEHGHNKEVDGGVVVELRRVEHADGMRVQTARDSREEARDYERDRLIFRHRNARGIGRHRVFANRQNGAAMARPCQHIQDGDGQEHDPEGVVKVGVQADAEHLLASAGPRCEHGVDQHADDFAEAQRDNGQIVALKPQRRHAHQIGEHRRHQAAHNQCQRERPGLIGQNERSENRGAVSADRHESRVTQRQFAQHARHQVQAGHHDDIVAHLREQVGDGAVAAHRREDELDNDIRCDRQKQVQERSKSSVLFHFLSPPYTFSFIFLPRMPVGRKRSTRMRMPNTIASTYSLA